MSFLNQKITNLLPLAEIFIISAITVYLLCGRNYIHMISSDPHNSLRRQVLLLIPIYKWRNWGLEELSKLPKATRMVSGKWNQNHIHLNSKGHLHSTVLTWCASIQGDQNNIFTTDFVRHWTIWNWILGIYFPLDGTVS